MIILIALSRTALILGAIALTVGGALATFSTANSLHSVSHGPFAVVFQALLSWQMFYLAWRFFSVIGLRSQGLAPHPHYSFWWYLLVLIVLAAVATWQSKHWFYPVAGVLLVFHLLGVWGLGSWLWFLSEYLLVATVTVFAIWVGQQRNRSLGAIALKTAFDTVDAGLAFFDARGRVMTMNWRLSSYLEELGITDLAHLDPIRQQLPQRRVVSGIASLGPNQIDVRLPSGAIVLFTFEELPGGKRPIYQLYATDITERFRLHCQLQVQANHLADSLSRVKELLHARQIAHEQNAYLTARSQLHDVLAQRMSLVHRFVEDKVDSPQHLGELIDLLGHLRTDLVQLPAFAQTPASHQSLLDSFALVGLQIQITGEVPTHLAKAQLFDLVLRECATNALVHSDAKVLSVQIVPEGESSKWIFSNQMSGKSEGGKESGLAGLRREVEALGGFFHLSRR